MFQWSPCPRAVVTPMRNKPTAPTRQCQPRRAAGPRETESKQLRRLIAHLQHAREEECHRMIQLVHDELLSRLVRASLDLAGLGRFWRDRERASRFNWAAAVQPLKEAIQIAARIRTQMRPALLDHCGLEATIAQTASNWSARHGVPCEIVRPAEFLRATPTNALELFRLFEDGLRSLTENSRVTRLRVEISTTPIVHCLTLSSCVRTTNAGYKLRRSPIFLNVRERALRLGGKVVVRATTPAEISLVITVPTTSS